VVRRIQRFIFKVQNPTHRSHWSSGRWAWDTFSADNDARMHPVYVTATDSGQGLYKCTPGPRKTGARLEIKLIAQGAQTNKPLAKQLYRFPLRRILPRRC
jgi:hypothetical protein